MSDSVVTLREARINWRLTRVEEILSWVANGKMPAPRIINGKVRWSREQLDAWEEAGCPRCPPPSDDALDVILRTAYGELPKIPCVLFVLHRNGVLCYRFASVVTG